MLLSDVPHFSGAIWPPRSAERQFYGLVSNWGSGVDNSFLEGFEELARDVAFQNSSDFACCATFSGTPLYIISSPDLGDHPDSSDDIDCPVQLPVPVPVEPVPCRVS